MRLVALTVIDPRPLVFTASLALFFLQCLASRDCVRQSLTREPIASCVVLAVIVLPGYLLDGTDTLYSMFLGGVFVVLPVYFATASLFLNGLVANKPVPAPGMPDLPILSPCLDWKCW